ncbi:MAG: hypothetical protein O7G87_19725 [bacterium]|nr:hypothetical protein [bacterium]
MGERPLWILLEDAFIVVSIAALWPGILGWEGRIWQAVQIAALAGLVWIFIRRSRRYKARKAGEDENRRGDKHLN